MTVSKEELERIQAYENKCQRVAKWLGLELIGFSEGSSCLLEGPITLPDPVIQKIIGLLDQVEGKRVTKEFFEASETEAETPINIYNPKE